MKNERHIFTSIAILSIMSILCFGCDIPNPSPNPTPSLQPNVEKVSDLDDPKLRESVFQIAFDETDLEIKQNLSGENIHYAPNNTEPYTGWVKNIRKLQQFQNGKKHGIFISWYGNWEKAEQGTYKDGIRNGVWIQWSPTGQKENEGLYKDGIRDGLWTFWDLQGSLSEITFQNGRVLNTKRISHKEKDRNDLGKATKDKVTRAFILHETKQSKSLIGLPDGAKLRLGKGIINNIVYSHDGNQIYVLTSIGLWVYDVESGEEIAVPGDVGKLTAIAFSPDGTTFGSIANSVPIQIWDTLTGKQVRNVADLNASADDISFSPDGRLTVTVDYYSGTLLWDTHTSELKQSINRRLDDDGRADDDLMRIFSPDGVTFAIGNEERLDIWDTLTGQRIQSLVPKEDKFDYVLFSPDGKTFLTQSKNGHIHLWDPRTWQIKKSLTQNKSVLRCVAFSPDGTTLVHGNTDGTVSIFNAETIEHLQTLSGDNVSVRCIGFSPDGSIVASSDRSRTIHLWDVRTGNLINKLTDQTFKNKDTPYRVRHSKSYIKLKFNANATILVSQNEDNEVLLWDLRTGKHKNLLTGFTKHLNSIAFNPDGSILASGNNHGTIYLWNYRTGRKIQTLLGHTSSVTNVIFSPDGSILASGSWDRTIRLWNIQTGKEKNRLSGHKEVIKCFAFSPDGTTLSSGGLEGELILWDSRSGQHKNTLIGHTSEIDSVSFSRDGGTLASGDREATIHLWDVKTGELKKTLSGHEDYVSAVLFSPDGKYLASGSWDNTIQLWNANTFEHKRTLVWDTVSSLSFSPDGKTIAGGSVFSRKNPSLAIRLWNVKTGQVKMTFIGHTNRITQVLFSPDGKTLASASDDGTILLWDVTSLSK